MGNFVHIELNSTDHDKTKAFYSKVFGWKTVDMPMTGGTYTMVDGMMNPGIGLQGAQGDMPSAWVPYIEVDDVNKTVAAATKAGAQAPLPFMAVQGPDGSVMGEMAWIIDPAGALFGVWRNVALAPEAAPPPSKKKASKRKAAKKKVAKKKASKKKAAAKKAPAKKAAKKKATKKKASKKKAAAKKAPAKKASKKKAAAKKRPAKKAAKKKATKKKASRKKRATAKA